MTRELIRYVIVQRSPASDEMRELSFPAIAGHAYATRRLAEYVLEQYRQRLAGRRGVAEDIADDTFEVLAVLCHPAGQPKQHAFWDDYKEPLGASKALLPLGRCDDCKAYGRHSVDTRTKLPVCTPCRRKATRPNL